MEIFRLENQVQNECLLDFDPNRQFLEKMGFKESLKEDMSKQVSKHPMV